MAKAKEQNTSPTPQNTAWPHKLTDEERRKGGINSGKTRRERALSFSERVRLFMEEHEEELLEARLKDALDDWRAHAMLLDRGYGTPAKAEPERTEIELVSGEARGTSLMDMLGELSQSPDNQGSNGDNGA